MAEACCNPFDLSRHNWSTRRKHLRPVKQWMLEKADIAQGSKICDHCRKKLAKLPDPCDASIKEMQAADESQYFDPPEAICTVNKYLLEVGDTPLPAVTDRMRTVQKLDRLGELLKGLILTEPVEAKQGDQCKMVQQLKEKFETTTSRSEQLLILTVLPKSWTKKQIQDEFNVSDYMARRCKALVREKGILSSPDPKPGHALKSETVKMVVDFYESDEISRMMPGQRDYISVRQDGKRAHIQKRLVLSNLHEVYRAFKDAHPGTKVGFSKFADLRPPQCVLAGASGTHTVCVCTIHQNAKLMFVGAHLSNIVAPEEMSFPTYHHCLAKLICNPPLPDCYLGECVFCPGTSKFKEDLTTLLDENLIENITFKQWVTVDRSTLETYTKSVDDYIDVFC